ncbi:MAG: hypothetical protein IJ209_00545 [Bacteroidaceae bacterium]|nr:hypothetical protein [Bacteroidaceae bacterium]
MIQTVTDKTPHRDAMMKAINQYVNDQITRKHNRDHLLGNISKKVINTTLEGSNNVARAQPRIKKNRRSRKKA